ncbi:hypothetical protein Tco_0880750 [Tanacetum coccineum]
MKAIKNDYDTNVMCDIAKVAGKLQIYVSHHPIDLSTVLIPNDGSLEESFARIIFEETKLKQQEALRYLHQMQKQANKRKLATTMATNPNDVRLTVFMALQEAHDEEFYLEEQMLNLMHRFADRFTRLRPEINMLKALPDHPLIDYGRYALERMTGANMRNAASLKMARDELLRSMEENFIKNYKEM